MADVLSQEMIPVSKGNLAEAIRGTFAVPLVYRPIKVNNKYVFDGGLYNNFPVDVLKKDFQPDYIIGSNVSSKIFNDYPKENDEKLMNRFLVYMFLSKSDSTAIGKNGAYIQPDLAGFSTTNFSPVAELIKRGYDATIADMPNIKKAVARRLSDEVLNESREEFKNRYATLEFENIHGAILQQVSFVKGFISDAGIINSFYLNYWNSETDIEREYKFTRGKEFNATGMKIPKYITDIKAGVPCVYELDAPAHKLLNFYQGQIEIVK